MDFKESELPQANNEYSNLNDNRTRKGVHFENDLISKFKTLMNKKVDTIKLKTHSCINDLDEQVKGVSNNNSFKSDMNKTYVEEFGFYNSGIWFQKSLNSVKEDDSVVVETLNSEIAPQKSLIPQSLLKKVRNCHTSMDKTRVS